MINEIYYTHLENKNIYVNTIYCIFEGQKKEGNKD